MTWAALYRKIGVMATFNVDTFGITITINASEPALYLGLGPVGVVITTAEMVQKMMDALEGSSGNQWQEVMGDSESTDRDDSGEDDSLDE